MRVGQRGRRRLLEELLVAALDAALAIVQVDHVAVTVGHDLDLDVPRPLDELLDVDAALAERLLRLGARLVHRVDEAHVVVGDAHAAAAAPAVALTSTG